MTTEQTDPNAGFAKLLNHVMKIVDRAPAEEAPREAGQPLRRSGPVDTEGAPTITLIEDDYGILRWRIGDPVPRLTPLGGRRAVLPNVEGEVVWEHEIQDLGKNTVVGKLQDLDRSLNSNHGLRQLMKDGTLAKVEQISSEGPILVLIHGTFSKTEALLQELNSHPDGRDFLTWAQSNYKQVLAFDHSTVSVSPFLNALEVSRLLNQSAAEIDVVCHSRGGLVTRWWLQVLDRPDRKRRRAVMVACTLKGTSLAAPERLRKGLEHLSNMVRAASAVTSAVPFTTGIAGLMSIAAGAVGAVAHTPAVDAIFAMVPGLAAMSRIQNNSELNQLQASQGNMVECFGVKSNFEPPDVKIWEFWKVFNRPFERVKNALADDFVFRDKDNNPVQNDLVVDCEAMQGVPPFVLKEWCDFKTSNTVHHTNYFTQPDTVKFMKDKLRA